MTAAPEASPAAVAFAGANPILRVEDIDAAVDHYTQVLVCKPDWQGPESFRSVSCGRCHLFLCQGDQGHPGTWVWMGVEDADALLEEFRLTGAKIRHPPTNYPRAYEMQVEDIDGDVLRLGSEPKENEPQGERLRHPWPALDRPARGRLEMLRPKARDAERQDSPSRRIERRYNLTGEEGPWWS